MFNIKLDRMSIYKGDTCTLGWMVEVKAPHRNVETFKLVFYNLKEVFDFLAEELKPPSEGGEFGK